MFSQFFYNRTSTIYHEYCMYKLFHFMSPHNKHIEFITARLINGGLEDMSSLDYKWHKHFPQNSNKCHTVKYWNFIVGIAFEHHKNNDDVIRIVDIESTI
jgi:hypothetical protein